jgi:hypothetical protein
MATGRRSQSGRNVVTEMRGGRVVRLFDEDDGQLFGLCMKQHQS